MDQDEFAAEVERLTIEIDTAHVQFQQLIAAGSPLTRQQTLEAQPLLATFHKASHDLTDLFRRQAGG